MNCINTSLIPASTEGQRMIYLEVHIWRFPECSHNKSMLSCPRALLMQSMRTIDPTL